MKFYYHGFDVNYIFCEELSMCLQEYRVTQPTQQITTQSQHEHKQNAKSKNLLSN